MSSRDKSIDFIKGCAIILMVLGHALDGHVPWVRNFITAFHMPVFVMAAGYFFVYDKVADSCKLMNFIWGKIKRIYFPFVLWTGLFIVLHNVFIDVGIYTDNPDIVQYCSGKFIAPVARQSLEQIFTNLRNTPFMITGTALSGAMWFLQALFWAYVLYAIVSWFLSRIKISNLILWQSLVSVAFLLYGREIGSQKYSWLLGGARALTFYALFHLGVVLRRGCAEIGIPNRPLASVGILLLFLISVSMAEPHTFLVNNAYNPVLLLAGGLSGWWMLRNIAIAVLNSRFHWLRIVCYIGAHTMPILIFHFLAFKIGNFILALAYGYPFCVMGACPVAFKNGWAWMFYTFLGVGVPLAVNACYTRLKNYLRRSML